LAALMSGSPRCLAWISTVPATTVANNNNSRSEQQSKLPLVVILQPEAKFLKLPAPLIKSYGMANEQRSITFQCSHFISLKSDPP
jgi:hypothetical protein